MSKHTKPTIAAVGTAFLLGLGATSGAIAAENPFAAQPLSNGYAQLAEAKCGEAKCGGDTAPKADTEGKCGEAKCGGDTAPKADREGKCGEAKCGGNQ
ncbi:hypothetical protein [Marinobacterium sediminicola]|uniref:Low-complexity protein n=1 Tax=Marinobacterium sediminicola TaxID=518898 RepID=A0ABY1S1F6_9GAMM|nr:hypothetical protein [Marinobacterium sediminicola]ULG69759.1 hypothetical protein LN244_02810 [Marinobacterium sediminicola]SMR75431.1 hypothetical protein SAMN04487964_10997 [Marinobacterium sediminicola]